MTKKVCCAVYTRKSTEEGLEQEFNSLHAQPEACEAFITSQKHEGWKVLSETYDDGGFSGGNMERPALQKLLAGIRARRIDVVVVYKVDRLTRSLADFAKIVEVLDAHDASFVSVTQQFNTTTSMGRLTLNVLLSFAQFEREVTGERIRDKIAASKKKGMWMGGNVPLGYDVINRKLVVNDAEAKTVRTLFHLYLEHGSVRRLREEAARLDLRPKPQKQDRGTGTFGRGQLYHLLANPIYIGKIRHRAESYPGEHEAIVDGSLWDGVQTLLATNRKARRSGANAREPSLLAGLLYDADGYPYTPSHAIKAGKRYRYYVERSLITNVQTKASPIHRLPALEIETVVIEALSRLLSDRGELARAAGMGSDTAATMSAATRMAKRLASEVQTAAPSHRREIVVDLVRRVVLAKTHVDLEFDVVQLKRAVGLDVGKAEDAIHRVQHPITLSVRHGAMKLIIEDGGMSNQSKPDAALLKLVVRAHSWWGKLLSGSAQDISDIAKSEGVSRPYVSRVLRLAFLAPDIMTAIVEGRQPRLLTAKRLTNGRSIPLKWADQRIDFGTIVGDA